MNSPQDHFEKLNEILQRHVAALEAEVRSLQQSDETAQWPSAWKRAYNWNFSRRFVTHKILRNWAADAAAWSLLPERRYPNAGNQRIDLESFDCGESEGMENSE